MKVLSQGAQKGLPLPPARAAGCPPDISAIALRPDDMHYHPGVTIFAAIVSHYNVLCLQGKCAQLHNHAELGETAPQVQTQQTGPEALMRTIAP